MYLHQNTSVIDADPFAALASAESQLFGTHDWYSPLVWRQITASSGLPGLDLPFRVGGRNWSARQMADIFAFCGRISLNLRDVPGGGHSRLLIGTGQRKFDNILQNVATAKEFLAIAITEESTGSDMHGIKTFALPVSGGYQLFGSKLYVARLSQASRVIIFAKVVGREIEAGLTAFVLPIDLPGLKYEEINQVGLEGVSFGGLRLEDAIIPTSMRVGGEGQGFSLFTRHFAYWRTAMAAAAIGCARGAIDQAINWLRSRQAFGGPIGRFTHLQQQLAEHVAQLHMAWLLVISVMERIDAGSPVFADAAMVKAEAVEIALAAVDWSMRIHGARGYTTQIDLEERLRDLLGLRVADGTTDVLRGQVARAVLGDDLYNMALGRSQDQHRIGITKTRRYW